ncbi:MAG: hypothetical protein DMG97_17880 [Acidobacteria bacterium]|nr:MAG: hypothetical protein DMG97_17880 [Acidobacteriota bacterium]
MIPEPQKRHILELLKALGPAADDFVVAGAQAMKFMLERTRATKDIDFVLDVVGLKTASVSVGAKLKELGYTVVKGARNFQFEKPIPGSTEKMRIEFMAPEEFKRDKDIRVDVEKGVHARACTGGSIAVAESALHELSGKLPDGSPFTAAIRVTKPYALVMLKLLALDERYRNIRGPQEARHDREEARTHGSDIVAIVSAQPDLKKFKADFQEQFQANAVLGLRVFRILGSYFRESTSPGLLVYEEFIVADKPLDRDARREVGREVERVHNVMVAVLPPKEFFELLAAAEESCDIGRNPGLVEDFMNNLERTRVGIGDSVAVDWIPAEAFGGAFGKGDVFTMSASEASKALSAVELKIVKVQVELCGEKLRNIAELAERFPHALARKAVAS